MPISGNLPGGKNVSPYGTGPDVHVWDTKGGNPFEISNSGNFGKNMGSIFGGGGSGAYHADTPQISNVNFAHAIRDQMGMGPGGGVSMDGSDMMTGQQQNLAAALQQQSMGQGPQADLINNQLQQATNQNIAQGAGQLAAQRGINPALAARMIGQNTANMNQQAVGQGINAQLASRLGAQDQLGGVLQGMRGQEIQQQLGMGNLNNQYLGTIAQANAAQDQNRVNAKLGNQRINADVAINQGKNKQGMMGGLMNAGGGLLSSGAMKGLFDGGMGSGGGGGAQDGGGLFEGGSGGSGEALEGIGSTASIGGGSPGTWFAKGGKVPGQANVKGDSPQNDTVDIKASPGEIIIPRSHSGSPEAAISFIQALMKKTGKSSYADVAKKKDAAKKAKQKFDIGGTVQADPYAPEETDWRAGAKDTLDAQNAAADQAMAKSDYADAAAPVSQWDQQAATAKGLGLSDEDILAQNGPRPPEPPQAPTFGVMANDEGKTNPATDTLNPVMGSSAPQKQNPNSMPSADAAASQQPAQGAPKGASGFDDILSSIDQSRKASQAYYHQAELARGEADRQAAIVHQQYQEKYQKLEDQSDALTASIMNQKIDPNRVWSNASTGSQIAAGIGILLSGIGSGMSGQPNLAMKVIDDSIARDVDAQKAEMGKKENLLTANYRKLGNMQQAEQATTAQLYAAANGQIAVAAAKNGGAQAGAEALKMTGIIKQRQAEINGQLAAQQVRTQATTGNMKLTDEQAAQIAPDRWVKLPDGTAQIPYTVDASKKVKDAMEAQKKLTGILVQMDQLAEGTGPFGTMPLSVRQEKAKSLVSDMSTAIALSDKLGVISKSDMDNFIKPLVGDPGSMFKENQAAIRDGLRNKIANDANSVYSANIPNYKPSAVGKMDVKP